MPSPFCLHKIHAKKIATGVAIFGFLLSGGLFVHAQDISSDDVDVLNQTIKEKKQNIDQINQKIEEYKKNIAQKESEKASLSVELDLLGNRVAKTDLEMTETKTEMDLVSTELSVLNNELIVLSTKLETDRQLIAGMLQKMQVQDQNFPLKALFGSSSLRELFDDAESLQAVSGDLKRTLEEAKQEKQSVEDKRQIEKEKQTQLEGLTLTLQHQKDQLDEEAASKQQLIAQTQNSQNKFNTLLQDLKQEQSFINQQIGTLQKEMEGKLKSSDQTKEDSVITWPIDPNIRGISTYFHDPTYPFRNLFEHSGIDLPAPVGTPVPAAAPGYVAWARTGRLYGNYVMIIHANGLATLYAHLSRIDVKVDQFVPRGKIIGAVGMTGFTTGPHLHFEIRKEGIPVNPIDYLAP